MKRKLLSILSVGAMITLVMSAFGAETVHLYLKANGGMKFNPSVKSDGMLAQVMNWPATAREAGSGQATGRRQYSPILIRKTIDKSSPLLAKALVNNEVLQNVKFEFFRPAGKGKIEIYRTVKLDRVKIKSIERVQTPASASTPPMEEISFVFHNITWEAVSKITAEDDWETPVTLMLHLLG